MWFSKSIANKRGVDSDQPQSSVLEVDSLNVFYGHAHALQNVSFNIERGVLGIVGRNGMGKSTLCNSITGLVKAKGSIKFSGHEILGLPPHRITRHGISYVPQGRRVWPSLSVDETLRMVAKDRQDVDRVYGLFPRLAERKSNGGSQLSGGEQQMLAIGRALLLEPRLLVMDEPTEGLAPVIVEQVAQSLRELARNGSISILLIEQNLGVALDVADRIGVMVNGRLTQILSTQALSADKDLQERLLGLRATTEHDSELEGDKVHQSNEHAEVQVLKVRRAHTDGYPVLESLAPREGQTVNRWGIEARSVDSDRTSTRLHSVNVNDTPPAGLFDFSLMAKNLQVVYVVGTFDTKSKELFFLKQCFDKQDIRVTTVDLSTSGRNSSANVPAREVARHHPDGESVVFNGDRGSAVSAMAIAFERFISTRRDIVGIISAGGSGGTTLATAGMRRLPIGMPKIMVSTMASGDTRPYVGPSDISMIYSVTDIQGLNRISERVLANAANALIGMLTHATETSRSRLPALGLTMFGVTTPCVQSVTKLLTGQYDCLVFHATGVGGQSMEKLASSNLLAGVIDVSTTEIADEIAGGILTAGPERLDVFSRTDLPWVGSCGALDMANFGPRDTVPERLKSRKFYQHNANVTLMRTTKEECKQIGEFLVSKMNAMRGPIRFLIPSNGLSSIDAPGKPFHDPEANEALFQIIESGFRASPNRKLYRLPHHINDEAFAVAIANAWKEVSNPARARIA